MRIGFCYDTKSDYLLGSYSLTKGEHTITIRHAVKNFWFYHLRIAQQGKKYDRCDGFVENFLSAVIK